MQQSEYKALDWHKAVWRALWASNAIPHALLLSGSPGIGKGRFARALAYRLLCENQTGNVACGECPSCRWLMTENHPDFRLVIPDAENQPDEAGEGAEKKRASRQIVIDQIRALEEFVYVGGHRNGARVVVIEPAEAMNAAAANSLLKILEEPPSSVYFILISSNWRRLLPTIRSRCQALKLSRPALPAAQAWLSSQGGADIADSLPLVDGGPLTALTENERGRLAAMRTILSSLADPGRDPLALAGRWQGQLQNKNDDGLSMEHIVRLIQRWVFELTLARFSGRSRLGARHENAIGKLAGGADAGSLIRCYNELMKFRALASHPLNPQLFLEDIAERYLRAVATQVR